MATAEAADRGGSLVEASLVRALAHRAAATSDAALADLGRALSAGVPAGYCRLFLDEGPAMVELLRALPGGRDLLGSGEAAALLARGRDAAGCASRRPSCRSARWPGAVE